ncbi:ferredoxin [Kitasatospora sp. NPDC058032]|uniref:ferredoxin n=1 Tax=Kitasatospora sp. NPDC058032 TaxID=3346307 RepID=UPI0036D94C31
MQVNVDRDRCCSSGQCVMTAPEVFEQDERDGLVNVRPAALPAAFLADVRLAADLCPGGAISVTETDTRTDTTTETGADGPGTTD